MSKIEEVVQENIKKGTGDHVRETYNPLSSNVDLDYESRKVFITPKAGCPCPCPRKLPIAYAAGYVVASPLDSIETTN